MANDKDLVAVSNTLVEAQAGQLSIDPEAFVQRAIKVHEATKKVAVLLTQPRDWIKMGEEAYATKRACEIIAAKMGISTRTIASTKEEGVDEAGNKVITFRCTAHASGRHPFTGEIVECERTGVANTRDMFFAKREGKYLPASEIDLPSLELKAETRAMNRTLKAALGFHPTWDELQTAFASRGQSTGKEAAVVYGTKKPPASKTTNDKAEIRRMCLEMAGGDEEIAGNLLEGYSKFPKDGKEHFVRSVNDPRFSDKWAATTIHKVKREYEQHQAEAGITAEEQAPLPTQEA